MILPHGVLFRGNAESDIRRNLIKQGYIKGIIGLPANLFYGTGIPACIIVIDKYDARERLNNPDSGIFMIDASKGFKKDGPKNRLRDQDIHKIVDVFNKQSQLAGYSRMVSFNEIEENEYNLNIPRYIDGSAAEDIHDLSAHLKGGIPNKDIEDLSAYWQVFPSLRKTLFADEREGYSKALVKATKVKTTILEHTEFKQFTQKSMAVFEQWKQQAKLADIQVGDLPKEIIHRIAENLLHSYTNMSLLDRYDMYQIIMDYWSETMQVNCRLIKSNYSDISFCGMTDTGIESFFDINSIIKGNIEILDEKLKVFSCEHWSDQPFLESQFDGLPKGYSFKWLFLFAKKEYGYHLVEKEAVYKLQNDDFAFCSTGQLISEMLNVDNDFLGEYVGKPIEIKDDYDKWFFNKVDCYSVKGKFAYLDQGVILDIEKFKKQN